MVTAEEARRELARRELARRRGQGAQTASEQPSAVGDAFSSFAAGVGRGAADLVGLPGTIGDALDTGGEWVMRQLGLPTRGEAMREHGLDPSSPLSGEAFRQGLSTITGGATDYQPQTTAGEYTRTVGEFLPGALTLGGGGLLNAFRYGAVPALTSEAAGQLTEDTAFEPYARIAGALLGGYAGSRIGRPAAQRPPSAREIKRSAGYGDDMTELLRGARTTDQTYQNIVRDLWDDVRQAGTSYKVQRNFWRTLQNELKMVQQEGASLHSLERLRRALRSAGGGTVDTPNQAIASRLIDKLDDAVDGLSAANIAQSGSTGRPVLDVLKEARQAYRTGVKGQMIEDAIANAQNAASGVENGLRNEFRKLLKPKAARNFNQTELDAIRRVVKGDFGSNTLRWLGTFGVPIDHGRNFLGSVIGGGVGGSIGAAVGGPAGAAIGGPLLMGIGTAAKAGASAAKSSQAAIAEALVKGGQQAQSTFSAAQAARQVAGREAILRALLQSQSAARVPASREFAQ